MKFLVCAIAALLLADCSHPAEVRQRPAIRELNGTWFSGYAINATDFVLQDCSYDPSGTFKCATLDHGCGSFCEAQTFTFSGTWVIAGTTVTRRVSEGWAPKEMTLTIEAVSPAIIYFSDGTRWFRQRNARNKYVVPPNATPALGTVDHGHPK